MELEAILHIPLSNYAFAIDEKTLVIRIRTAKNDIKKCELFYGDRACPTNPIEVTRVCMERIAFDQLFDYYEAQIDDCMKRVCYYFELSDGTESRFYCGAGIVDEIMENRNQYFQFPYIRREDIPDIPAWTKDVVMYQIFPDSFASGYRKLLGEEKEKLLTNDMVSRSRLGGTLQGIIQNLDYIENMGFNCIYINPIFTAAEYHKYDTINYFEIDPCFGTKADLAELVKKAHGHGIRVILDGVFNHCGSGFFAFQDVLRNGENSRYKDWFYKLTFPIQYTDTPNYETFAYVKEMPKMNTGNKEVVRYFCDVGKYWVKEVGIDGWRLDVANEIDHNFWREFRKAVRSVKKDALLIAEIWEDSECWLKGDQFDSTMNYTFSYNCIDFFARQSISAEEFDQKIQHMLMRYPRTISEVQMNLLDSHDVPRFLNYCDGNETKLKLAIFYLLMSVGIPSIFYGDECLLDGKKESEYRRKMEWNNPPKEMQEFLRSWVHIRRKYKALSRGNYRTMGTEHNLYVFMREYKDEKILVLVNNAEKKQSFSINQCERLDLQTGEQIVNEEITVMPMEGKAILLK